MKQVYFLAATEAGVGLTSICLGLVRAIDRRGIRVAFSKPISQTAESGSEHDLALHIIQTTMGRTPPPPIPIVQADSFVREEKPDDLMELVVARVDEAGTDADIVVVEGLLPAEGQTFNNRLNRLMASSINAEVILVTRYRDGESSADFNTRVETAAALYGGVNSPKVVGCIVNRIGTTQVATLDGVVPVVDVVGDDAPAGGGIPDKEPVLEKLRNECRMFKSAGFELIGGVPLNRTLLSARTLDVARHLSAEVLSEGDLATRRVHSIALCARSAAHILHVFTPGALLVMPSDRDDVIMAAALAAMNGVPLAGVVLTGGTPLQDGLLRLCRKALETGLPLLRVPTGSYETARDLSRMNSEVAHDDVERMNLVMDFIARNIGTSWIESHPASLNERRMSPPAFRHMVANRARSAIKRIVLPEGDEPRTIHAAISCEQRGIAKCLLIGDPTAIRGVAEAHGLVLPPGIEILDAAMLRPQYVAPLVEMRRHKNLSEKDAAEALEDNVMLGTVMLALGEVDGLVSGAVHSSANTIRPALQIIKTKPEARVVSSVFFMCLPEQVLVYGDCAVNPDPTAEELADIAIQSAESAIQFGIPPRVALISYSTGASGSGADVEKVRRATDIAKSLRPDIPIDGPLQYDAAANEEVAATKAPGSPVAGRATVFVFPDLNTGNTTYKAVQRSANLISIGPMLQGLRKPVNDLSRGALIDDIIYTIAVTAIQAQGNEN